MTKHGHEMTDVLVLGALGVGAWWIYNQYFAGAAAAAAVSPTPTPTPTPTITPILLSPPSSSSSSVPSSSSSSIPQGSPEILYPAPGVVPTPTPTPPLLVPATALNTPDTLVGQSGGVDIISVNPASAPDGTPVLPSNFVPINNPITGVQTPVQFVTATGNAQLLQPAQNLCVDGVFGNPGGINNPSTLYSTDYAHVVDGIAATFQFFQNNPSAVANLTALSNLWFSGPGPAATQALQLMMRVTGYGATQTIDYSSSAVATMIQRALIAASRGQSYTNTVPDSCFVAAWNEAFGQNITALS